MLATDNTSMGKIITTLTVTNRIDQAEVERGIIPAEQVRSVTLDNVLVDTGATTLCLPPQIIAQLGLSLLKEVDVEELPGGMNPLLGVIPLEALGIELDLKNQRLIILPISPTQTYLTIL
jgi:hypothetical protein